MPDAAGSQTALVPAAADEQVRSAAKWLLAAFAGLFAFLAGGWQLGTLGELADARHPALAAVALAASLAACASVILLAALLLVDLGLTLDDLLDREVRAKLRFAREAPTGSMHTASDFDPILKRLDGQRALIHAGTTSPSVLRDSLQSARQGLVESVLANAEADVVRLLLLANRVYFSSRFRRLVISLSVALVVVLISVGMYSWSMVKDPRAALVDAPIGGDLYLNDGVLANQLGLGSSCQATQLKGASIGGTVSEPIFVSPPTQDCRAAKLIVTSDMGVFVPEIKR